MHKIKRSYLNYCNFLIADSHVLIVFSSSQSLALEDPITLKPDDDHLQYGCFGWSVAFSDEYAVVGAPYEENTQGAESGAVYIFKRDEDDNWRQVQKLTITGSTEDDGFGYSIALSRDYLFVGAPHVHYYTGQGRKFNFTKT